MGSAAVAEGAEPSAPRVDRRVRRSRRAIVDAFGRLIAKMPLEDMTVSMLAREADVDRKTFYQHFGTIDGLLDAIAGEVVSDLLDEVERTAGIGPDSEFDDRLVKRFFDVLARRLSEDLTVCRYFYKNIPADVLFDHLSRPLADQIVGRGLVVRGTSDTEFEMMLTFVLGGLFSLCSWWLDSDHGVSPEQLARYAIDMVEGGVEQFVWARCAPPCNSGSS